MRNTRTRYGIDNDQAKDVLLHPDVIEQVDVVEQISPQIRSRRVFSQLGVVLVLAMADIITLAMALYLAILIRLHALPPLAKAFTPGIPSRLIDQLWWVLIIGLACLTYENLYSKRLPFWRESKRLVKSMTLAFILMLAVVSLGKMSNEVSRTVLVLGYLISIILLPLARLTTKTILTRIGFGTRSVLILGAGKTGELVARMLLRDHFLGYRVAGFLDDNPIKRAKYIQVNGACFPVMGTFSDCDRIMEQTGARHIIIATPGMSAGKLVALVNHLQRQADSVAVIPDLVGVPIIGIEANYSIDEQMLSLHIRNNLANPLKTFTKRLFDLVVGTIILIAVLPIMLLIMVAVKLDSPGASVFSHSRIGKGGTAFKFYKFRTMYVNNEEILQKHLEGNHRAQMEWRTYAKLKEYDPRVTRAGKLLRKTSLDELPQIFNVIKGEMSLVGPRPYLPGEFTRLGTHATSILSARPGVTGLWQVSGRNKIDFEGRLGLESWYVRNWSLWLDITLLARTLGVVLAGKGAY
ncbi:MAG TPA: undecaprenyl-phosphate galactose phosphotransferase WbaP [Candidatus Aquicultor sp.]|jgi:undecaprenyl-phosphate galactose phosphotransferase